MWCLACAAPASLLCRSCAASLRPAAPRRIGGVAVDAAFAHVGAAPRLVHAMKYRGSLAAARFLAQEMVRRIDPDAACVVPVPRTLVRRLRFGIDPAVALASIVSSGAGLPLVRALDAPVWSARHAGRSRARRSPVPFRRTTFVADHAVLVDDVVTTGATIVSAMSALGSCDLSVLTATSAGTMERGAEMFPAPGGDVAQDRSGDPIGQVVRTPSPLRINEPQTAHAARHNRRKEDG